MITEDIITGLLDEVKYFISQSDQTQGTVILNTGFKDGQFPGGENPIIFIYVDDAPETIQLIGGVTKYMLNISFTVSNINVNQTYTDDNGYSLGLTKFIDQLRQYFCLKNFYSDSFVDLKESYNFVMNFKGITKSNLNFESGNFLGYSLNWSSIALEDATNLIEESKDDLENVDVTLS